MTTPEHIHAVALALAVDLDGPLAGALLLGPSGAGKSELALSLIEACPYRRSALVADDVVVLEAREGALFARPRERMSGLIEMRGFGPVRLRALAEARLIAAFDIVEDAPRLPEPASRRFGGVEIPAWPFVLTAAAPARFRLAMRSILGGQTP